MNETPAGDYLEPYRRAVERFGASFPAMLWHSRDSQIVRFDVMIAMVGFDESVILDVGCGTGDFAARLIERKIPFKSYVGVDALSEMIQSAGKRGFNRCRFETHDVLLDPDAMSAYEPDFICFSGTLNTMEEQTARSLIGRAFMAALQGVVFNFLSDRCHRRWLDRDLHPARRFNTVRWLDWAMDLSSRVTFTQEYLDGHDATILIRHEEE